MIQFPKRSLLVAFALLVFAISSARAEDSGKAAFAYALGSKTVGANHYSISATAPRGSKLNSQTIRFALKKSDTGSQTWGFFLISTGKSKTQLQIEQLLAQAFRKFPGSAPGTELAKIGDIKYGGEVRVMAEGPNALVFAYNPPLNPANPRLNAADAAAFAEILGK